MVDPRETMDAATRELGPLTVKDLIHEWVHHDRDHFRQLQANVQAYVWPTIGNCQKFAGE